MGRLFVALLGAYATVQLVTLLAVMMDENHGTPTALVRLACFLGTFGVYSAVARWTHSRLARCLVLTEEALTVEGGSPRAVALEVLEAFIVSQRAETWVITLKCSPPLGAIETHVDPAPLAARLEARGVRVERATSP